MKANLLLTNLCLLLFFSMYNYQDAKAQSLFIGDQKTGVELGLNIGPNFFLGDLGGNRGRGSRFIKDVNLGLTKVSKGAFLTIYPKEWLGLRFAAQFGKLEAKDEIIDTKGRPELFRKQRNLDFRTNLFEAYFAAEIFPLELFFNSFGDYNPRLMPYGIIGVGMYKYNPQGSLTDANGVKKWYDLKPLRLEGQGMDEYPDRKEYKLTQVNIPVGAGVKYWLSAKASLSFELLLRKSFNDYVDDVSTTYIDPALYDKYLSPNDAIIARAISDKAVSIVTPNLTRFIPNEQRGNPNQNDSWFTTFIKFGWRLTADPNRDQLRRMRCPAIF